jgi:hypothetical protein
VVLQRSPPPNITKVLPWGAPVTHTLQNTTVNTTDLPLSNSTSITMYENTTIYFNITAVQTVSNIQSYAWTYDNQTFDGNTTDATKILNFFSNGTHTVRVNVTNDRYESVAFTWHLTILNVNQPPILITPLSNVTLTGSRNIPDYFYDHYEGGAPSGIRFLDPDDDTNSNGDLDDPNETNTLVFSTNSSCSLAPMTIAGSELDFTVRTRGSCLVYFSATDRDGVRIWSDIVKINITNTTNDTSPQTSAGGGGGSTPMVLPITKKTVTPKAFNLITPKLVTIYNNKSIDIPIIINNTWTSSLQFLRLRAETNATGVNTSFDTDLFEEIPVNQSREVILTISNYRLGNNYEVKVIGNTTSPAYQDTALILLNSIESSSEGDDVNVKVTFANDLVNEHPECQELNEVLDQAKRKIADGNLEEGKQLVESVINGCKYLVSMQQNIREKPSKLNPIITIDNLSVKSIMLGVLAFVVLSSIAFIIYYHYTHKAEDDI